MLSVLVAVLVLKRTLDPESLPGLQPPLSWGRVLAAAGVIPLICVGLKLLHDSDFVAYGFYVAFAAAVLVAAGGILICLDEKVAAP